MEATGRVDRMDGEIRRLESVPRDDRSFVRTLNTSEHRHAYSVVLLSVAACRDSQLSVSSPALPSLLEELSPYCLEQRPVRGSGPLAGIGTNQYRNCRGDEDAAGEKRRPSGETIGRYSRS